MVRNGTRFYQIKAAVEWICSHPFAHLSVPQLAQSVGMSATSFHRHFKAVTAFSPLAYQQHLRMLEARRFLISGKQDVTTVAYEVGFVSPSQFSREYKRLFGVSPVHHSPGRRSPGRVVSLNTSRVGISPETRRNTV